ncbi:MAG: cytochrome c biogenesis protein ResB, partial [Planctomycetes bacterium]|nr:cytochrome c biogenesis protein ResB [Planctomycetota bacterium]
YHTLWIGFKGLLGLLTLSAGYGAMLLWTDRSQATSSIAESLRIKMVFLRGLSAITTLGLGVLTIWLMSKGDAATPSDASMRILWQLTQSAAAGGALLAGCWIVFARKAGIVLLHAGIGLMMYYELHVAMTAVETQMNLEEGERTDYVHDIRTYELAIIDKTDATEDKVVAIPKGKIVDGNSIDAKELPFIVVIDQLLSNSHLRPLSPGESNPSTTGLGLEWFAEAKRPGSGVDTDSKVDMAATYVTLKPKDGGAPLGTYLVGMLLSMSGETDTIRVGEKTFELALRPKRYYKPYVFELKDVKKEDYIGTSTPRNYASTVHIVDRDRNVDEEKTIWMNNPLRFANETFYQSGYHQEKDGS